MSGHSNENKNGFLRPCELSAGLYLVATPIGNLRDMTLRAIDVLKSADLIACEDTRVSGKLLKAYDIRTKMIPYHDHSDESVRKKLLTKIAEGASVALISDAGCPVIADPGYKLVRDARLLGLYVTTIPGANAAISAVQLSAVAHESFIFGGFLPSKQKAREDFLMKWKDADGALVVYETAPRLIESLASIQKVMGGRQVSVVREITKMYEEARTEPIDVLILHYEKAGAPKGEIVLVIAPPPVRQYSETDIERLLREEMKNAGTKQAAAAVAEMTGLSKSTLYEKALKLK